jgi:hypothetical protein
MNWYLQLERPHEFSPRLAVPFVYVPNIHISGHWDPDALARWNTMIPIPRLVSRVACTCAEITDGVRTGAGKLMEKLGLV